MALVGGLAGDPERLGDLRPGPPLLDGVGDAGALKTVGLAAQCHHRGERIGRVVREGETAELGGHVVNAS
jgi:hypothetical protein